MDNFDVVFLTSEMYPFSKTGGLADVMGALPPAMAAQGKRTAVITPLYGRINTGLYPLRLVGSEVHVGYPWEPVTCDVYQADYHGVTVYFIQREEYFDRRSYYNTYKGDYFDNCERFIFFCRAAYAWMRQAEEAPRVVNANDWQTGLVPAYIKEWGGADAVSRDFWSDTVSVMTIHNMAFQGRFASRLFEGTGLPASSWSMNGCEFYGDLNLLKTGISYADIITTVSPTYAEEILTDEFGAGLSGVLRPRTDRIRGILNGADYDVWDPENDHFLYCGYNAETLENKHLCKKSLLREMYLSDMLEDRPLLGFIGRLRWQKGIDMLINLIPRLMDLNLGVVVLGEGDLEYEAKLLELMERYHGLLSVSVSYTEDLAHRIQAASDLFLMPSRYEPCGLTQMYALRYATPPVASRLGGLRDTITPCPAPDCNGFSFDSLDEEAFFSAIKQAVGLYGNRPQWRELQLRAMGTCFSWADSASRYVEVYREAGARL